MGRGDAARRRKRVQQNYTLQKKPGTPAQPSGRAENDGMTRSLRKMIQLKAAADAAGRSKGRQQQQGANAAAGSEAEQEQQQVDAQQVQQQQQQQQQQEIPGSTAPLFAAKTLKSRKKDFLNKKKRGKHAQSAQLTDKESQLAAAAAAGRPAFGEQAHQPLKVVLKRKHWAAEGTERQAATRRCTAIFERQMAGAVAAQDLRAPVSQAEQQQTKRKPQSDGVRQQLIDAYRQQKQSRLGDGCGAATVQSLAVLVRRDANDATL